MNGGASNNDALESNNPFLVNYGSKGLNNTQTVILQTYFEQHLEGFFQQFITLAHASLQTVRVNIISQALIQDTQGFIALLAAHYPAVSADDPTYIQNQHFREKLMAFNQLCTGKLDVNHELYSTVFDTRISSAINHSPTKHNLIANFFKKVVREFLIPYQNVSTAPSTISNARKKLDFGQ